MSRLPITLWRGVDDMADVDRFAAPEVDHLPSAEPRGADGAHFLPMAHDDLVSRSNLGCCVDRTDSEDVALREEVLDLEPVSVRVGEDRPAGDRQRPSRPRQDSKLPAPEYRTRRRDRTARARAE